MKRDDILSKEAHIRQWIAERRSKSYICMQLQCKSTTLETYLRKLGITYKGNRGRQGYCRTSHRKPAAAYLHRGSTITTHNLKLKLIRDGLKLAACESCALQTWLSEKIPLELHHLNGDRHDNRLENLQILCPNCHALTANHAGKASGKKLLSTTPEILSPIKEAAVNHFPITVLVFNNSDRYALWREANPALTDLIENGHQFQPISKREVCLFCGNSLSIASQGTYCSTQCYRLASRKAVRPSKEELEKLVWEMPTTQIAKQFGVSDVAIAKWCKSYSIAKPPRGYWAKISNNPL